MQAPFFAGDLKQQPITPLVASSRLTVSVVICAYTEDRWDNLVAAVRSVRYQLRSADELLVVIDHNDTLFRRATEAFPDAEVVSNSAEVRGIAGARNSGVIHAHGDIIAYLDDDAIAEPEWLRELLAPYRDPEVIGTGSRVDPGWPGRKPDWFPDEFGWVVGCSYKGQPEVVAPVRNFIANGMSLRREAFNKAGDFLTDIGRIGKVPLGCEETELCIRVGKSFPSDKLLHVPSARVQHNVPVERLTLKYFILRCLAEGLSKHAISRYTGAGPALETERIYTLKVLPHGLLRGLHKAARGNLSGAAEALAIIVGLIATTAGYIGGRFNVFLRLSAIWGDRGIRGRNMPNSVAVHS